MKRTRPYQPLDDLVAAQLRRAGFEVTMGHCEWTEDDIAHYVTAEAFGQIENLRIAVLPPR